MGFVGKKYFVFLTKANKNKMLPKNHIPLKIKGFLFNVLLISTFSYFKVYLFKQKHLFQAFMEKK